MSGSGPAGRHRAEDAVTVRSEERVVTSTVTRVTGRARLERVVTEEERTVVVRLKREQVRLVHEDASAEEEAPAGLPRATPWIVLHAERAEVTTVNVPIERVRLVVDCVSGAVTGRVDVRREVVEVDEERTPAQRP